MGGDGSGLPVPAPPGRWPGWVGVPARMGGGSDPNEWDRVFPVGQQGP